MIHRRRCPLHHFVVPLPRYAGEENRKAVHALRLRNGGEYDSPPFSSPVQWGRGTTKWWRGRPRVWPVIAAALGAFSIAAASNDPADRLPDPAREARARALFTEVRCLVCQNESIDDSDAELASDLRRVVRTQIAAGRSDAEVKHYLVERYGEFVLLRPPFNLGNAVLWLTPFAIVLVGGGMLILRAQRQRPSDEAALTLEEEAALAALDPAPGPGSALEPPHEKLSPVSKAAD